MTAPRTKSFSALICVALLVVTWALYHPVTEYDLVHFDDTRYVLDNAHVRAGLEPSTIAWAFSTDRMGTWHPLTWISHAADWSLYGSDGGGHHLTSLLLHALNVLLLFGVLSKLTGAPWPSAFVALVFAVHPLNVASVAWVASRKGVLSTTFWLLTMGAYARYARRGTVGPYLLVVAAFALALLSKPMVVSLPLVLLLLDVWPLKRVRWNGRAIGDARPWLDKLPLFAMASAVSVVVFLVRRMGDPVPWTERWAQIPSVYLLYLERIFWPVGLATPYPPLPPPTAVGTAIAVAVLAGLTFAVIRVRTARPYLTVGWLWFVVTLAPVSGVLQIGAHPMADRWMYVPMIGVLIVAAWGLSDLLPRPGVARVALFAAAALSVASLAAVTYAQIGYWKDTEALFGRAIDVTDDNRTAHYNLAWYLAEQGRADEAVEHYRRAIEITPDHFPSHHNLALLLWETGQTDEAIEATCAALRHAGPKDEPFADGLTSRLGDTKCP